MTEFKTISDLLNLGISGDKAERKAVTQEIKELLPDRIRHGLLRGVPGEQSNAARNRRLLAMLLYWADGIDRRISALEEGKIESTLEKFKHTQSSNDSPETETIDYAGLSFKELQELAKSRGVKPVSRGRKREAVEAELKAQNG